MAQTFIPQTDPYSIPSGFTQTTTSGGGTAYLSPSGDLYIRTSGGFQLRNDLKAPTSTAPATTSNYTPPATTTSTNTTQPSLSKAAGESLTAWLQRTGLNPTFAASLIGVNPTVFTEPLAQARRDQLAGIEISVDPSVVNNPAAFGSGLPSAPQAQSPTQTAATSVGSGTANAGTLPPALQATLDAIQNYLEQLQARGQVINPNVEITPEKLAEFMAQAQTEIHPYYATQLGLAKDTLLKSINFRIEDTLANERTLQTNYQNDLRGIGESAAERGMALSGRRLTDEQQLATGTQSQIDAARRRLAETAGSAAANYAQQYGGGVNVPTIAGAPRVLSGEANFQNSLESPVYSLSPDIYNNLVGSKQYEEIGATRNRASQLESAFRTTQANAQQRSLIL